MGSVFIFSLSLLLSPASAQPSLESLKAESDLRFEAAAARPADALSGARAERPSVAPAEARFSPTSIPRRFCGKDEGPPPPPEDKPFYKKHKLLTAVVVGAAGMVVASTLLGGGVFLGIPVLAFLGGGMITLALVGVIGFLLVGAIMHALHHKDEDP